MRARLAFTALLAAPLVTVPLAAHAGDGIALSGPGGAAHTLTAAEVAALPAVHLEVAFDTEHGPRKSSFDGPLLWTVLTQKKVIDPAKPRDNPSQAIVVTGSDGYVGVLAMGEISPAFANKQIVLADKADGKPLDHLRVVVPGDVHGGRSVHDVARIAVVTLK